ncbi:MAG: hypothetical protein M4579_003420 [Chaenotheca gracillima]|nr:MAG: hypothetical protein M4579_003420 [Chaenotheca gracillima]
MGIFNRKGSTRPTIQPDAASINSNGTHRSTNSSIKSPTTTASRIPESSSASMSPSIPDIALPPPPDPNLDPAAYLRSIYAVRQRSRLIFERARRNDLSHFNVDMDKFSETANYVVSIIKRDYAPDYASIPPHGRWQHFDVGGRPRVDQLLASWPSTVDIQERTRRLLDLFLISVLLDAGAGNRWSYKSKESGRIYRRSEGLAVASLEMFKAGYFSSDTDMPYQVDGLALKKLDLATMARGLQVSEQNPMTGLEGRTGLLIRLGDALSNRDFFGRNARPGNMLDYLLNHPTTLMSSVPIVTLPTLWTLLMDGLASIWPRSRTLVDGISLGDAWPCSSMPNSPKEPWKNIVPFHKLTQWLTYSLMVPMTKLMKIRFAGAGLMTGLPEYRNGGLLVDTGLLTLKPGEMTRGLDAYDRNAKEVGQPNIEVVPLFTADDDVVVEWRAVTVGFLDELLIEVNRILGLSRENGLSLPQMLEAGTWKGGRELAEVSRPNTKEPPIMIISDGTVF